MSASHAPPAPCRYTELAVVVAWPGSVMLPKLRKNWNHLPSERPPRKKSSSPLTLPECALPMNKIAMT